MKNKIFDQEDWGDLGVGLTQHALSRMDSRGISLDAVQAAVLYGRKVYTRGAEIRAIGRKEVKRLLSQGIDLRDYEGVQVVRGPDGGIVTVYRNRDFRGLRPRRRRSGIGCAPVRPPLLH